MDHRHKVGGYVKLAKLWERSKDAAVAYHSSYYAEKFRDDADKRLVGVYIDITGNKEIYKRPEMVHLLKDCKNGSVNLIFSQTRAYLAANTCDFCFLLKYLFDMPMRVDVVTDDDDQRIDTILDVDNQRQSLKELAEKYTSIRRKDYLEWRIRLEHNYDQIAMILTQKKRSTLRGRQEWNGVMVANIMKNERRWGDLEARKSIVVDYKLGKVTKNNGNRCSAYVPEHHEAIVSPEIARAAHLVASSSKKCGVQDIVVIRQGALKGFVGIHPNWSGINVESIRSLSLSAYMPEEVTELNKMAEMRSGKKSDMALPSDYLTLSGAFFINQSSPVMTISQNGIRFSKACHTRLDDCEYVELLYHPILQVVILRKSNCDSSTAMQWREGNDVHSAFSARAFSGLVFQTLNWRMNCRYQCRGICRGQENAQFLLFELDESRILTRKNQYEQAENRSMNLECRLYRSKWIQSITARDVMESGQVVENPMIGTIPSRNEVQRELDDLLMSM